MSHVEGWCSFTEAVHVPLPHQEAPDILDIPNGYLMTIAWDISPMSSFLIVAVVEQRFVRLAPLQVHQQLVGEGLDAKPCTQRSRGVQVDAIQLEETTGLLFSTWTTDSEEAQLD
jgi:hypothetical protein